MEAVLFFYDLDGLVGIRSTQPTMLWNAATNFTHPKVSETVDNQELTLYNTVQINMEDTEMNFNFTDLDFTAFPGIFGLWFVIWLGWLLLIAITHIVFAIAVYRDARVLDRTRTLIMAGPGIWCIATLIGGVFTATIYWAMHHSRLNPDIPIASTETEETQQHDGSS